MRGAGPGRHPALYFIKMNIKMKKAYVNPECEWVKMEIAQLIAISNSDGTAIVPDGSDWQTNQKYPIWDE